MKKINYLILSVLIFTLLPICVLADGNVTVSTDTITVEQNSIVAFDIIASNAAGELTITLEDSLVATIDKSHVWIDSETVRVNVQGKTIGSTKILLKINAATYDEEVIKKEQVILVNVIEAKSKNADLSSITINGETITNFDKDTITYTIDNITSNEIVISATSADSKALISGIGTKTLKYGLNCFEIVVTAENGNQKTYTINVKKNDVRSGENALSSLTVSPNDIEFITNKTNYSLVVENSVKEIKIDAKAKDSKATIVGLGTKKLNVYNNKFIVVVTAENGNKKTYTIEIVRKDELGNTKKLSSDNDLKTLTIKGYNIKFNSSKTTYYLKVENSVTSLVINAKSQDSKAKVTINNVEKLQLGENTITINVEAQNGKIKTYTIVVTRDNKIPQTTLNKLIETLSKTDMDTIIVNIKDDNNILTKEMLIALKNSNKKLIINKYSKDSLLYTWEIEGKDITNVKDVNTLVEFNGTSDELNELLNSSEYTHFKNNLDTSIFNNIKLKLYLSNKYDNKNIYGYCYQDGSLIKEYKNLEYDTTYIELEDIKLGNYVLSQENITKTKIDYRILILLIIFIILLILMYYKLKKEDKKFKKI